MANYISACRSNYFKIGKPKEFLEWLAQVPDVEWSQKESPDSPSDMYGCLIGNNPDGAGWPSWIYTENEDGEEEERELDFFLEVSEFLAPGEIAVFEEVGSEKLRYLYGQAIAVRSDGEIISISLFDIYDRVKQEWPEWNEPTQAAY